MRQKLWFDWESRRQQIYLEAFCISRNLVTNAEYQAFIAATGHQEPGISQEDYQQQGFLVHSYNRVNHIGLRTARFRLCHEGLLLGRFAWFLSRCL